MNDLQTVIKGLVELKVITPELLMLDAPIFESTIAYPNDIK
jgi:hypothetical protein